MLAWTAHGDPKKLQEASQEFLKMLVSVALAALAATGMKGNLGKGFKIADAIKIQPPRLGWSPAMVTPEGVEIGGGPVFTPGSIASTGPVHIEPNLMAGVGYGGSRLRPGNEPDGQHGGEQVADNAHEQGSGEKTEPTSTHRSNPRYQEPYDPNEIRERLESKYPGEVKSSTVPPRRAKNVKLRGGEHKATGIKFDRRGFPIFDDVAIFDTRIPSKIAAIEDRGFHFEAATKQLRDAIHNGQVSPGRFNIEQLKAIEEGAEKIPGFTWHHHQDIGRMQLVPEGIHGKVGHVGGHTGWFEGF